MTVSHLILNTEPFANIQVFPFALGNTQGIHKLNMREFNVASAYNNVSKFDDVANKGIACYSQNVFQFRAQYLIRNGYVEAPTDIKVDVDGNELEVLKGFGSYLFDKNLKSVNIELIFSNPKTASVVNLLRTSGFKLINSLNQDGNYTFLRSNF